MTAERWFLLNFLGFFRKKIGNCLQVFRFISIFAPKMLLYAGVTAEN
jgi:hypothetical protein